MFLVFNTLFRTLSDTTKIYDTLFRDKVVGVCSLSARAAVISLELVLGVCLELVEWRRFVYVILCLNGLVHILWKLTLFKYGL
jgi:hypothetical protein